MNILIEGLDNVGKDTQIKLLCNTLFRCNPKKPTQVLHYSAIPGLGADECIKYSSKLYADLFQLCMEAHTSRRRNIIANRAHLGEAVYGPIYRGYDGNYVFALESIFEHMKFWEQMYLIVFIDKAENLIQREDGKSFSIELDKKQMEIIAFKEAFRRSIISHKLLIDIDGKNETVVHKEVLEFIQGGLSREE